MFYVACVWFQLFKKLPKFKLGQYGLHRVNFISLIVLFQCNEKLIVSSKINWDISVLKLDYSENIFKVR